MVNLQIFLKRCGFGTNELKLLVVLVHTFNIVSIKTCPYIEMWLLHIGRTLFFKGLVCACLEQLGTIYLFYLWWKYFVILMFFLRYKSEQFKAVLRGGVLTGSKNEIKQYNCKTQHLIENNHIFFWIKSTMIAYFTTEQIKYF